MNKVVFLVIIHLVVVENVNNNTKVVLSMTESGFFKEINSNLDNMTQVIHNILKLDQNYTQTNNMKLLKLIHESLRNVSESNFRIYYDIKNASTSIYVNTSEALFNLTKIIDEVFNILEINSDAAVDVVDNEFDNIKTLFKRFKTIENLTGSEGMISVMKHFIREKGSKLRKHLTRRNKKHKKRKFNGANHQITRKTFYNLKPWRLPKNYSELEDYSANRRIYKGKRTKQRFPFIVSIHVMGEFMCSGSIIARDLVITAATCLQSAYNNTHILLENPNAITVRAGSELTLKDGIVVSVVEIYFHPMYDSHYLAHNLAIARIKTQITEKNEAKIRRIVFDKLKAKLPESGQVTILGWGDKDSYSSYAGPLTMARLEVYGLEPCKEIYSENYVQDTNFCAGFVTVGGGACNKDVGGPGLMDSLLVGVVSFGPPVCGSKDAPTVYTKLGFYSEWIEYVIKKVLRSPYENTQSATLPLADNNSKTLNQLVLRSNPSEVMTLKRLFKDYVLSGIMDIHEIIHDDDKGNTTCTADDDDYKISTVKSRVVSHYDDFPAPTYLAPRDETERVVDLDKIYRVVYSHMTRSTKSFVPATANDKKYVHDSSAVLSDDGELKSNSLTKHYDGLSIQINQDDDQDSDNGLSIEMGHIERSRLPVLRTNIEQPREPISSVKKSAARNKNIEKLKSLLKNKQKVRQMDAVDQTREEDDKKTTVLEFRHTLDINFGKFEIPPSLMKVFSKKDAQNTSATTKSSNYPVIAVQREGRETSSDTDSDLDSKMYENLKYMV